MRKQIKSEQKEEEKEVESKGRREEGMKQHQYGHTEVEREHYSTITPSSHLVFIYSL